MAAVRPEQGPRVEEPRGASPLGLDTPLPEPAQRALTFGLLLSALRCTVQYIVLPFVLPWIGVAAAVPIWVVLGLSALALFFLARNVRNLWRLRHARRWSYLILAAVIGGSLLLFAVVDVHTLLHL